MSNSSSSQRPWWSFGHLWLVIAGPLVVVVASFITFYLAANGQDPVLSKSTAEVRADAPDTLTTLAPAMQARNHAATGTLPVPESKK
ncbi:MAG: nitrogen fixation protein FixH [Limnohabitans sp.]